jgi:hypothetical protein
MNSEIQPNTTPLVVSEDKEKPVQRTSKNAWRNKLYEYQYLVAIEQYEIDLLVQNLNPAEEAKLPEDEQKIRKETFAKELSRHRSNIKTLASQINEHRMNKNMSSFFQWIPNTTGANRQQARKFRRLRGNEQFKRNTN